MAQRRHSRGTPALLTRDQQIVMVKAADENPDLRLAIETLIGRPWRTLKFQEKLAALESHQEVGYAANAHAGAARGMYELKRQADLIRHGVAVEDRLTMVEQENTMLREKLVVSEEQVKRLRHQLAIARAKPSMAVHSTSAAP